MILGPKHPILGMDYSRRLKTVIGNNVKIGSGSILLFGVHVGDDAVITAGSVVSKDVPAGAVFAGNPARDVTGMCKELWKLKKPVKDDQQKK
jgi:maltose O-acetyltransferase